jgi:hypothetical protein
VNSVLPGRPSSSARHCDDLLDDLMRTLLREEVAAIGERVVTGDIMGEDASRYWTKVPPSGVAQFSTNSAMMVLVAVSTTPARSIRRRSRR